MEIMHAKIHSPFLGLPLQCDLNRRKSRNYISGVRSSRRGVYKCRCLKKGDWITQGVKFTHSCGRNVELLWKSFALRSGTLMCSVREPLARSKGLVKSLVPVWEEGLFFVRCSIFGAVISGVCLLLWYGQLKAKSYIEAKLLPSVCALLSEYVQRELDFGRVRSISPLSITLESCSFGPHSEEFSCGELPTVKLRIRPFSSLSRGKIVVDAVLSNPSILVVQKQNYTWLGLPFSEGSPLSRLSDEEGIDLRTKIRRIAREEAATRWARERDVAAREAVEKGYLLPEGNSFLLDDDFSKNVATTLARIVTSESFFCMDEKLHWRDQHHMDAGGEYDLKHADLEKTFGAKVPPSGTRFWSKIIPDALRQRFKKANGRDLSAAGIAARRRILERSASAACLYFKGPSNANLGVCCPPYEAYDVANPAIFPVKSEGDTSPSVSSPTISEEVVNPVDNSEGNLFTSNAKRNVFDCGSSSEGIPDKVETCQLDLTCQKMLGTYPLPVEKCGSDCIDGLAVLRDPFLLTLVRLCKALSVSEKLSSTNMGDRTADGPGESSEEIAADIINRGANSRDDSHRFEEQVQQSHWGTSDIRQGNASSGSGFTVLEPLPLQHPSKTLQSWSPKSALYSFVKNLGQLGANSIVKPMERLKFEMSPRVEDIVAELVDGDDGKHASSVEKMVPVILDSVHFSGGSLMLLAYGDTEPREMENVTGHVKFQNHYGRVHVQLNGNCKMWRSDIRSDNGGWLSTDVYVDMTEQKWHANLKIVNLFVPLFERILEIPITWSKGRASGEVHMCMDKGESFPNLHGQLDVTGLAFQIYDAPSGFWDMSASLCFRAQRIFLHNTSGWFGDVPLEASGDFGINPEEGEFHLMCQVPSVEVNALMKTFKMKPLLFPLAGSVTAVFNCQGPLDIPVFVGSALVSRKIANLANEFPKSAAYEAVISNKEAGAVAAIDRVPFSYISANFTFNTDNCVADLYGIRASLTDGGEIRGAGNAWICPEEQTAKILHGGKRWFDGNFMKLERWIGQEGCVDPRFFGDTVMVNLVGLPIHLWCVNLFRKVGDLLGGFVNVICSLHDMSRVRLMVRKGGRVPVSIKVDDGEMGYIVWLSIEFRPMMLPLKVDENEGKVRKGGEIGGVRGGRVVEKGGTLMPEAMDERVVIERKKGNVNFEFWKERKNPNKGKRHPYPWISEQGCKGRKDWFSNKKGVNRLHPKESIGTYPQKGQTYRNPTVPPLKPGPEDPVVPNDRNHYSGEAKSSNKGVCVSCCDPSKAPELPKMLGNSNSCFSGAGNAPAPAPAQKNGSGQVGKAPATNLVLDNATVAGQVPEYGTVHIRNSPATAMEMENATAGVSVLENGIDHAGIAQATATVLENATAAVPWAGNGTFHTRNASATVTVPENVANTVPRAGNGSFLSINAPATVTVPENATVVVPRAGNGTFHTRNALATTMMLENRMDDAPMTGNGFVQVGSVSATTILLENAIAHLRKFPGYLFWSSINKDAQGALASLEDRRNFTRAEDSASKSRLDRFLVSTDWEEMVPDVLQVPLPRLTSDHSPIMLDGNRRRSLCIPFRFENMWLQASDFEDTVDVWWNGYVVTGTPSFRLASKLKC
ncbi:hypothetical protein A4A49_14511 [Nicotiana attenuata]|uniref:Uncharacterized protein n=1 Tax=Nicotiana attenuata TaxID=49451 RepID=A0A314L8L1_NICAT|nr:hypothetical protein A4A49_14511 [Nicotiana attenuata]